MSMRLDSLRDSGDFNLLMTMRPDTAPAGSGAKKSIARLPSQPDDKFVVTVGASTRVSPMVRKVIRLKKDSVEDLYWKTRSEVSKKQGFVARAARDMTEAQAMLDKARKEAALSAKEQQELAVEHELHGDNFAEDTREAVDIA